VKHGYLINKPGTNNMSYCTVIETVQPAGKKALHENCHDKHHGPPLHGDNEFLTGTGYLPGAHGSGCPVGAQIKGHNRMCARS